MPISFSVEASTLLAKQMVQRFENFEVVTVGPPMIYAAIDCSITTQISFWDAPHCYRG